MRNNQKTIHYSNKIKKIIDNFSTFDIEKIINKEIVRFIKSIHKSFDEKSTLSYISNYIGTFDKDKPLLQDGWIDKNGNWYSCESGGHEIKSQMIICFDNKLTDTYLKLLNSSNSIYGLIFLDNNPTPSDFLITNGWLKIQNIYKPSVVYALGKKLTKAQINTIYNLVDVFNLNSDPLEHSQVIDYSCITKS